MMTIEQAERDLVNALGEHLSRLKIHEATLLQLDDLPTVTILTLYLCSTLT